MSNFDLDKLIETNLKYSYSKRLRLHDFNTEHREKCLTKIFDRDIKNNPELLFQGKRIFPTNVNKSNPEDDFARLYTHLTCGRGEERKPYFEMDRSRRLHWIKYHLGAEKNTNVLVFSFIDKEGYRTYIYDKSEKYVVILEPYRKEPGYYLITAYHCSFNKHETILSKYERRLPTLL